MEPNSENTDHTGGIWARLVADSVSPQRIGITTLLVRMPRCILAEFNTHRMFSRNAASSRAIPVQKLIEQVKKDPFIPTYWGKNQPGMQATEEFSGAERAELIDIWLWSRDKAITEAEEYVKRGVHKQIVNRLLEPWMYTIVCVTSTNWSNFFALRRHETAEPHIQILAEAMHRALANPEPDHLEPGMWHLPFTTAEEKYDLPLQSAIKLSTARCASTSYKTVEGEPMTLGRAMELFDKLITARPMHASPAEHQATPDKFIPGKFDEGRWLKPEQHGNFYGWVQHRKTLPEECV